MYRDDTCQVCGESLPPDHLYCRQHAAEVDERLHEIASLVGELRARLRRLSDLVDGVAPETWDYLAEPHGDPDWPPACPLELRLDPADLDVDVDSEPGYVRLRLRAALGTLLEAVHAATGPAADPELLEALRRADGAGATH